MQKMLWNDQWKFAKEKILEEISDTFPNNWQEITLPHDWLIYDTQNLYEDSVGWYRKNLEYVRDGKSRVLRFEGVYMNSTIYVNGLEISSWKYGYSTFDVDVTPYLREGSNEITVRVIHQSPNSRWYSGAGIYRNVYLCMFPETHFVMDGIYITPQKKENDWEVTVEAEVAGLDRGVKEIGFALFDPAGARVSFVKQDEKLCKEISEIHKVQGEKNGKITCLFTVKDPVLWDIGKGNLYKAVVTLVDELGNEDEISANFGFRTLLFDANKGFFINGRHEKIKGSCEHHGFSCLGAVANKSAIRKKLIMLRKMGVNAIRTAHNMPSAEFMELADEMGFLVDSEAFDIWGKSKTTFDYARFFEQWAKKDVASWIRRDRNHPSIIMWSVGNEIYDIHEGQKGLEELQMLISEVRKHDPRGHAKITFASNYMRWENAQKCGELVDLVGYNYGEYLYDEHHQKHPDWIIYGSETASMLASRGVYHFPLNKDILCEDDLQCSALGNSFAGWGAHDYLDNIVADAEREYSLGQFIWTGFDYFGEPTPYHTRNSYFGMVDTAGFPKDAYYIYQAEWTDYRENPMVHVFPYWDFNEKQVVDVCVCSNAPKVELFLNGKSLGSRILDHAKGKQTVPSWSVPYEKGELLAYAYDLEGRVIASDCKHSFEDAHRLAMKIEPREGNLEEELLFVEISARDKNDYPVENACNRVLVEVEGPAVLLGLDNGDSSDFEQVKTNVKKMFQGKLLAIVAPIKGENGEIKIKASSVGLLGVEIQENREEVILAKEEIEETSLKKEIEIPIRKLELFMEGEPVFGPDRKEIIVSYRLLPENATYTEVEFKVVNDLGIELSIAGVRTEGNQIFLKAYGDGEFQLRGIAKNGQEHACVRSCLTFKIEGLGAVCLNPYNKINGGLCLNRPKGLSEGVEHGIRFLGKENTMVYFGKMDFGRYGADSFTAELFKYTEGPVFFQIYEEPEEDDDKKEDILLTTEGKRLRLLCKAEFEQKAGWLEFKEQNYPLEKKICGVKTLWIESRDNFQLRRFWFQPVLHGLEKIYAGDCDEIFGDSYEKGEYGVDHIGNNTTLTFEHLNFGEVSTRKLRICGKTDLPNTTIHVKIESERGVTTELFEFARAEEYTESVMEIAPVQGDIRVSFIFLPGSKFDFAWFRFERE